MARKRPDSVYENVYAPFMGNPDLNRKEHVFQIYWRRLTELSMQRFKWIGLPESVDERFIERTLLFSGLVVWFFDPNMNKHLAMRGTASGQWNIYDNPTMFTVVGNGYPTRQMGSKKCVPIWPNYLRLPENDVVRMYAQRLAEFDRTIDINMVQMRKPYVIRASETQRMTAQNLWKSVADGDYAVFTSDSIDPNEMLDVLDTRLDKDLILKNIQAKREIWNEALEMLGISGSEEKKERMITDEVSANSGQIVASRNVAMNARQFATEQINRMFKLSVSVEWNMNSNLYPDMPGYDGGL